MPISQDAQSERAIRQGCRTANLADLRRQLARPHALRPEHRQRLLELARCLAHVRRLGDEYGRVCMSEHVSAALDGALEAGIS